MAKVLFVLVIVISIYGISAITHFAPFAWWSHPSVLFLLLAALCSIAGLAVRLVKENWND